jgi:RNA polymerase sigma-70 factor
MAGEALVEVLRAHLARPEQADAAEIPGLLSAALASARAAWPALCVPSEAFVARLAHHAANDVSLVDWLRDVFAADLYLATACAERVPNAIDTFDREFLGTISAVLARGGLQRLSIDDIRQRVRERLFVGASKIGDYSGRGALTSWVQVVILRIAIDVGREQRSVPIADSVEVEDLRLAGTDPELTMIKERYREPFKSALRAALAGLTSEQRNLLKLHFVDGATLDRLAIAFHVHRATIARRLAQAREAVFDDVRTRLQAELGIDHEEFDDLLTLLRSRLELSLSALMPRMVR